MNKSPDSELVKVVARSCQLFDDAYNNNDPRALTELFTENATLVTDSGVLNGRDAILKYQIEIFNIIKFSNHKGMADPDSIRPLGTDGKEFLAAGSWSQTVRIEGGEPFEMKGFWSAIVQNDGTARDSMLTWNITPVDQAK